MEWRDAILFGGLCAEDGRVLDSEARSFEMKPRRFEDMGGECVGENLGPSGSKGMEGRVSGLDGIFHLLIVDVPVAVQRRVSSSTAMPLMPSMAGLDDSLVSLHSSTHSASDKSAQFSTLTRHTRPHLSPE